MNNKSSAISILKVTSSRLALGLISGTSLDGIDAALVRIEGKANRLRVKLLAFETYPYPVPLRAHLLRLASGDTVATGTVSKIHFRLGELFAQAALALCREKRIQPASLHCIGSHGQTVFHQGRSTKGRKDEVASTLQLAEPSLIAERCGVTTVADFRPADIAAGGEGAPLVPLVDYLLFAHPRKGTVALNLGGIANVTVIPAGAEQEEVYGFDTGPANMVVDALVRHQTKGKVPFDRGGRIASRGRVIQSVLKDCMSHPFFRRRPPKSAGREQFGKEFVERFLRAAASHKFEDIISTATELTAATVATAIHRFVLPHTPVNRVIASGGGVHNRVLRERLADRLPGVHFHGSQEFGILEDAKEAVAFAILADRTLQGLPGNLPAVTGAQRAAILGKVIYASRR